MSLGVLDERIEDTLSRNSVENGNFGQLAGEHRAFSVNDDLTASRQILLIDIGDSLIILFCSSPLSFEKVQVRCVCGENMCLKMAHVFECSGAGQIGGLIAVQAQERATR